MTLGEFELAQEIWDVAEPALPSADRDAWCAAFSTSEPILAMRAALRALTHAERRIPANLFDEFETWLLRLPPLQPSDRWLPARLEIHVLATQILPSKRSLITMGGYSEYTLCRLIFAEADVPEAAPHSVRAAAMRQWLAQHRPGPALRADMRIMGFSDLLGEVRNAHANLSSSGTLRRTRSPHDA